jgi:hypothetical protein
MVGGWTWHTLCSTFGTRFRRGIYGGNAWGDQMYIELGAGGRILAAYVDQQYPGQKWLPIDSHPLQAFLAAAPTVAKDPMGLRGLRRLWRSSSAHHAVAA